MIVVCDASPLIGLSCVGRLDLLQRLYQRIVIPVAVSHEIGMAGGGRTGAVAVPAAGWIEIRPVADQIAVTSLRTELDEGEAEAIALAVEIRADLLLIDERLGDAVAKRSGLRSVGTLAVLIEAKARGHLEAVKPILDDLVSQDGFWVGRLLYNRVLIEAGE